MTITVTMDTQAVAEDATLYGLELLPISTEVTVPTDSTVSAVMRQWAADTGVAVVSADSGFITTIGNFGGKGTAEFTNMCAAAGLIPFRRFLIMQAGPIPSMARWGWAARIAIG